MKIQHVQLSIPEGKIEEARRFYIEILGLPEIVRPENLSGRKGFWLALSAGQEIHLAEDPGADPSKLKAHVALTCDAEDRVESRLNQAQVPIEKTTELGNERRVHFRDPFGNRIELIAANNALQADEDLAIGIPKGDLERILKTIESHVESLLQGDRSKLMNWLYRLDVGEKSVKAVWDNVSQSKWARRLSELIFQRELQKYFNRR